MIKNLVKFLQERQPQAPKPPKTVKIANKNGQDMKKGKNG